MSFQIGSSNEIQPLAKRIPNENFQQQGQVDWVSLTNNGISFSMGILARLSASSVDPFTVAVGHCIGNCFELSRNGRKNIENALSGLKCKSSISDAIWFGFGIRHIVHSISTTEQGATLVALCAALSECYPEETSAEILAAIVRQKARKNDPTPAVRQWQEVVKCIGGTFAATLFSIRAEALMRMKLDGLEEPCSNPKQIADVLLGVGDVSKGLCKSISILGPREAGWVATVAEWLFDLTVSVTDEDGTLRYSTCPQGQIAQVQVFYRCDRLGNDSLSSLRFTAKVFDIRSAMHFIKPASLDASIPVISRSGRVAWAECLSAVFGPYFDRLMRMDTIVGQLIGSAGALFEAVTSARETVPSEFLVFNRYYFQSAFGIGFVHNTLHLFPELAMLKSSMFESCKALGFTSIRSKYEECLWQLRQGCGCIVCISSIQCPHSIKQNGFCLVVIAETVIVVSRLLSAVDLEADLAPFTRGLQMAYNYQLDRRNSLLKASKEIDPNKLGVLAHILDSGQRPRTNRFPGDIGTHKKEFLLLLDLFAGYHTFDANGNHEGPLAVSERGICVYFGTLREVSDSPDLIGRMHIVPGAIEYNERPYFCISGNQSPNLAWQQDPPLDKLADQSLMAQTNIRVYETARNLAIEVGILDEEGQEVNIAFDPCCMLVYAGRSRGLVTCDPRHHEDDDTLPHDIKSFVDTGQAKLLILEAPTLGRCAALSMCLNEMILRGDECLACCVRTGLRENFKETLIISS